MNEGTVGGNVGRPLDSDRRAREGLGLTLGEEGRLTIIVRHLLNNNNDQREKIENTDKKRRTRFPSGRMV